ncbi:COG3500 Phage protein D [uncultured Caudovirales phage]|uniref:COG3500 Phage protein D n=1 Tax=uncultured Caudovirales phage TaxID=2100421 RepID=A0A6J5L9H7_9CAUD|nr:COG3500 Phage protein D [uncultured Caudovirales phage]
MSSYVTISFPNSPVQPKRVHSAILYQEIFSHDYAEIELRDWKVDPLNIKPGSLMILTIRGKDYHGYVHQLDGNQSATKSFTKIGFIGASYVMKQASQKIYRGVTASQIIAEIAKKYNFAYRVTAHPRVYEQVSQAGLTDWQLMVNLAKECGYFLRAENTEIHFHPVAEDFDGMIHEAVSFQKADAGFKPVNPIYEFKPIISETLNRFGFRKTAESVSGVNPVNGQEFRVTTQGSADPTRAISNAEFFDSHATQNVANSYEVATHLAKAAHEYSKFPYVADVKTIGLSSIRPCMPVYLKNVGGEYSGYWTIIGVTHSVTEKALNQQMYTCDIQVATDSLGTVTNPKHPKIPAAVPKRQIVPNQKNKNVKPKTVMLRPSITSKRGQKTELVDRINRPALGGPFVATSRWGSTHRDLNYKNVDEKMPQAVWQKLRSKVD